MAVHPTAIVSPESMIGENVEIGPYSVVCKGVAVGEGCIVGSNVVLEEGTRLGRRNSVGHGSIIGSPPQDKKYQGEKSSVEIGENNIIREYVTIHRACGEGMVTRVGNNNMLMVSSHIGHNCQVGNDVVLTNLVALGGHVVIEDGVVIGGLTGIHQFARAGKYCMIGGLSAVRKDVPPYSLVSGDPARLYGLNKIGLRRMGLPREVRYALEEAFRALFLSGCPVKEGIKEIKEKEHLWKIPEIQELIAFVEKSQRGIVGRKMENIKDTI